MSLSSGTRLGPYEILAPAGSGGMGVVYKARDTRLNRSVAIKVLPEHLASNPDLRQRFEREAQAISSLQHPHICVLHDVGHDDASGIDFLVLEYLEGETLSERLAKGPLPVKEILRIGSQVAEALDKAHRNGITHRDLKPGNVMLTAGGAKLMDFGLAKPAVAIAGAAAASALTPSSPTSPNLAKGASTPLTAEGSIVGTFQYMSPEQIQGEEADARSDIFGFGAVLYEMATGKRAFGGKSQIAVAGAILEKDPEPVTTIRSELPSSLAHVISRALAKDPADRWQSARDIKAELDWIGQSSGVSSTITAPTSHRRVLNRWTWGAIAALVLIAIAVPFALLHFRSRMATAERLVRAELEVGAGRTPSTVQNGASLLSPDGTRMLMIVGAGTNSLLMVRDMETGTSLDLTGTEGAIFPFWSPDGQNIGFFSTGKLRRIPAAGGPVQVICDAADGRGASWNENGVIVFTPNIREGLYRVPEGGGTPEGITKPPTLMHTHRNPYFLPGGETFLFTVRDTSGSGTQGDLYVGFLSGKPVQLLIQHASNAQYSDGYLFYLRDRNLLAQKFDPSSLKPSGNPIAIAEGVEFWNARDVGNFSVAGSRLTYHTNPLPRMRVVNVDRAGREQQQLLESGYYSDIRVSPNGRKLSMLRSDANGSNADIWVADLDRKTFSRATFVNSPEGITCAFSPDSNRLLVSTATGFLQGKVWIQSASGAGQAEETLEGVKNFSIEDWSRDGRYVIGGLQDSKTGMDLVYFPVQGERKITAVVRTPFWETEGRLSPNGKWLAYSSTESGQNEVYVTAFPGGGQKLQISTGGGASPLWSADGRELFFVSGDKLKALPVSNVDQFEFGAPVDLMVIENELADGIRVIAVAPDGKSFFVLKRQGKPPSRSFTLLLNWKHLVSK